MKRGIYLSNPAGIFSRSSSILRRFPVIFGWSTTLSSITTNAKPENTRVKRSEAHIRSFLKRALRACGNIR